MNNNQLQNPSYFNQALENYLADWKSETSKQVVLKAKTFAGKKLPKAKDDKLERYTGFFKEKANQCIADIERILKVTSALFGLKQMKDKRDDLVFKLEEKKTEIESKLIELKPKQSNSESKIIKLQSIGLLMILLLLAIAEGCLSYKPFYFLTGNHFGTIIISIVFAIIWAIAAEKFPYFYMKGEGLKRNFLRILLILGFSAIFYAIAHLRVLERISVRAIINEEPLPNFWDVNFIEVLILTAVGWLFFLGGVWISQYAPNYIEIKQAIVEYLNRKKIKELQKEHEETENQIQHENDTVAQEEYKVLSLLNIRKQAINEVVGHYKYLIEEFKDTNITYRVDGVYPDCFHEQIELDIDTTLPNLKQDIENQY